MMDDIQMSSSSEDELLQLQRTLDLLTKDQDKMEAGVIKLHNRNRNIHEIDVEYGVFIGKSVNRFIGEYKINKVDLISSHGHTVFHQPENGKTLQIGSGLTKKQYMERFVGKQVDIRTKKMFCLLSFLLFFVFFIFYCFLSILSLYTFQSKVGAFPRLHHLRKRFLGPLHPTPPYECIHPDQ